MGHATLPMGDHRSSILPVPFLCPAFGSNLHRYDLVRPLLDSEWASFTSAISKIQSLAVAGRLGSSPDSSFDRAPTNLLVVTSSTAVSIRGKGIWRPEGCSGGVSLFRDPLVIERRLKSGTCDTGGRPYDAAVRLALILLAACAPKAVCLTPGGDPAHWSSSAALAAEVMGRDVVAHVCGNLWRLEGRVLPARTTATWYLDEGSLEACVYPLSEGKAWRAELEGAILAPFDGNTAFARGHHGYLSCAAAMEALSIRAISLLKQAVHQPLSLVSTQAA